MMATDQPGLVIPRGRQFAQAVVAGILWMLAVRALLFVPGAVAFAHREQWSSENQRLAWAQVGFLLFGSAVLLLLAGWLSIRAHGRWAVTPRMVRVVRASTWTLLVGLAIGSVVVDALLNSSCFRTCSPFPN